MDARTFGNYLSRMRKAQGLTQAELAEQLHVTDKAVSRWERGIGLPDINTLEPLAAQKSTYFCKKDKKVSDTGREGGGEDRVSR